jgi:hypothetical protein
MKRIIQGLVLAALVSTAQASPFPADGETIFSVPAEWTYADRHAGEPNTLVGSAIPADGEASSLAVESTYADRHAGDPNILVGSAFPASGD